MKILTIILFVLLTTNSFAAKEKVYTIEKGEHYSKGLKFGLFVAKKMKVDVRFDNSAIYNFGNSNQADTNKLIGFSDCLSTHHKNSARLGWRWFEDELQVMAYAYADGKRQSKVIGAVPLNEIVRMSIYVDKNNYFFKVGPNSVSLKRGCSKKLAVGYKLFPYFGGDEVAPNDIHIYIKKVK
jgi:hypothetical protein